MTPKFAIDANIVIKWFTANHEDSVEEAREILAQLLKGKLSLWAPDFLLVEAVNISLRKKKLPSEVIKKVIFDLETSGIHFIHMEHDGIHRALELADQNGLTMYDALYLVVAKEKKCQLITQDEALLKVKDWCVSLENWRE